MSLKCNRMTHSVPVSCLDQAENIRNAEAAANKAFENIQSLYNEIMTPKIYPDVQYEQALSDNSSSSPTVSIVRRAKHQSYTVDEPKPVSSELCKSCQKVISYCTSCHKSNSSNISWTLPQDRNFRRHSYHPDLLNRRNSHRTERGPSSSFHSDLHHPRNSNHPGEDPSSSHYLEHDRRHSHHPEEDQNSSCYPERDRRHSNHIERDRKGSYYKEQDRRNSHYQENRKNSIHLEQNRKDLNYTEEDRKSLNCHETTMLSELDEFINDEYDNYVFKSVKESNVQFNVTVPRPFSITAENVKRQEAKELKISKLKEELNSKIEKELNVKFSSKPVPKHVHLPLYGEMMKKHERRKQERKEKCIEILNEKTKPFNLGVKNKACISKSKSVSDLSQDESKKMFKAKPIPKNILSENVSQKLKNKEEIRKLLIAQRAEEMLKKSSLPFSPKAIPRSHSFSNLGNYPKGSNVNVTKQTIEAITKRLYTIKCRETIENWNSKVLQNELWNIETSDSKQSSCKLSSNQRDKEKHFPNSALPFSNFPVRMTTASSLRDNRIRADIDMRKKREKKDETIREEIARKRKEILKNIWTRLKAIEPPFDAEKEIEEKVKSYRVSQKNRELEYEKELEEMMERVSKQFLLIERQSKDLKVKIEDGNGSVDETFVKDVSVSNVESDSSEDVESPLSTTSEKTDS